MRKLLLMTAAVAVLALGGPEKVWAQCTGTAPNYTCNSGTQTTTVGGGRNENNSTVDVGPGATISTGNSPAISLGSNSTIDIYGTVENNATSAGGGYGTGNNAIEVGSLSTITVRDGGVVNSQGPQNSAEAINVHGFGNTIIIEEGGTVRAENNAAIWFQDSMDWDLFNNQGLCTGGDCRNTVINDGTILTGLNGGNGNVFGSQAPAGSEAGIRFTNSSTGFIQGSLNFGGGDDELTFVAGTGVNGAGTITGSVDGGGGSNLLTLTGASGMESTLTQQVTNFSQLNKQGESRWTIVGDLVNFDNVTVYDGTLVLEGNNRGFTGILEIMAPGTSYTDYDGTPVTSANGGVLEARAQSLPYSLSILGNQANIINNGTLILTNDTGDDGAYLGQIVGSGDLYKVNGGTVLLTPSRLSNLYTGTTYIQGGALAIYRPQALGTGPLVLGAANSTGVLDVLASMTLDKQITIDGAGTGTGGIYTAPLATVVNNTGIGGVNATDIFRKSGPGTLELNGVNTFAGETTIVGGRLRVNSNGANNLANNMYVFAGAHLEGVGAVGSAGHSVFNSGIVQAGHSNSLFGTLTIRGDYTGGPDGLIISNVVLGDDSSAHNTLVIGGTANGTPSSVQVVNINGQGANAPNGIPIIVVQGATGDISQAFRVIPDYVTADGTAGVIGGITAYQFVPVDMGGGRWEFRLRTILDAEGNPVVNPAIPVYEAYPAVLSRYMQLGTLQQRVGHRSWSAGEDSREFEPRGAWVKLEGQSGHYEPNGTNSATDATFDLHYGLFRFGFDLPVYRTEEDSLLVLGVGAHGSRRGRAKIKSTAGDGRINVDMVGLDGTLTWYGQNGFYADFQSRASWFESEISSHVLADRVQISKNDGFGYAFGLEAGWELPLNLNWSMTPQIQAIYSDVDFDSFYDAQSTSVVSGKSESLVGRLGLAFNYDNLYSAGGGDQRRVRGYVAPNLYYEFLDGTKVSVAGTDFERRDERLWGGLSVGGTYDWGNDSFSLYGELNARTSLESFGDSRQFSGEMGFRVGF